jgi:mannosyltransferase OCH1-like enzyme
MKDEGGIYIDLDYVMIKDPEPIIEKYDQIYAFEHDYTY